MNTGENDENKRSVTFGHPLFRFGHFRSPFPYIISTHRTITQLSVNQCLRLIKTTHDSHRYLSSRSGHENDKDRRHFAVRLQVAGGLPLCDGPARRSRAQGRYHSLRGEPLKLPRRPAASKSGGARGNSPYYCPAKHQMTGLEGQFRPVLPRRAEIAGQRCINSPICTWAGAILGQASGEGGGDRRAEGILSICYCRKGEGCLYL